MIILSDDSPVIMCAIFHCTWIIGCSRLVFGYQFVRRRVIRFEIYIIGEVVTLWVTTVPAEIGINVNIGGTVLWARITRTIWR